MTLMPKNVSPAAACDVEGQIMTEESLRSLLMFAAGMFSINGNSKGHAFGASSKLDSGGADLPSEQPQ